MPTIEAKIQSLREEIRILQADLDALERARSIIGGGRVTRRAAGEAAPAATRGM